VRNNGKRALVLWWWFIYIVPKVNKKCDFLDMIWKMGLLRNMFLELCKVPSCFKNHVKGRYTLDIKSYCDKKIKRHFSSNISFPVCIEKKNFRGTILNILKCHYSNILKKKISFYQNVVFTFYQNIVCKNV